MPPAAPETDLTATPPYAWVILVITFLAALCASALMDRVAPVIPDLMGDFGVGLSSSGLLMSVFGLTGLILTLPAGLFVQRLGIKTAAAIGFGFMIAGIVLGALSRSFGLMLFSRMLEGVGNVLIYVITPAVIAMWFPPDRRGLPLGVWSAATPMGGFLIMTVIPRLAESVGWRGAWWVSALFTILVFILFWLLIRPAPGEAAPGGRDLSALKSLLGNKSIFLVSVSWLCIVIVHSSLRTFYPTYLVEEAGYTMVRAGALFSLSSIIRVILNPLAGLLSDTIGSRRLLAVAGSVIYLPIFILLFQADGGMASVLIVLMGIIFSIIPVMIIASVPDATGEPALVPMGMAILQFGFNLGIVVGPPAFGWLAESLGWTSAAIFFSPVIVLTILSILFNKRVG